MDEILRYLDLGIHGNLSFEDVQQVGLFLLRVGGATLDHVGRGIGHVLPILVAGLLADPLLGKDLGGTSSIPLLHYLERCDHTPCLAFEEVESHLHGLDQLNIARWRGRATKDGEKAPGELHHVPKEKEGKLKKKPGWRC